MTFFPNLPHHHHLIPPHLLLPLLLLLSIPISGLPTIAIIPGSWQSPIHYTKLTTQLRAGGYDVISHPHPSIGSQNPAAQTAAADAAAIHDKILFPLIVQRGEDVVLVMHGYGGLVGPALADGLSKVERARAGLPGGITGMIFIAGFVSAGGRPLVALLPGGRVEEWVVLYPDTQTYPSPDPIPRFYNDLPNADLAALFAHELRNQSLAALTTPPGGVPAWLHPADAYANRRAYGFTVADNVVPLAAQEAMAGLAGVEFHSRYFATGHCPFVSQPEVLAEWIGGLAVVWEFVGEGGVAVA